MGTPGRDGPVTPGAWPGVPAITDRMREGARSNPNSWLYVVDPAFADVPDPPQWAVVGAYPVNADGEIEDRFAANDTYRPSPLALGWPEPATALERTIQLAKAGHRPAADLPASVLDATLLVYDPADGTWDGSQLIALPDPRTGRLVVPACTSADHVPADWPGWKPLRGSEIVPLLRGYPLAVDPDGPVSAILPAELLAEALRARSAPGSDTPTGPDDPPGELRGRHRAG
jgi:hypothetical protein